MKILGINFGQKESPEIQELKSTVNDLINQNHEMKSALSAVPLIPSTGIVLPQYRNVLFDGEKNDGALGPILTYVPDYYALAQRSWTAYITNDIAKTVIDKWVIWIIDQGLSLKSNPAKKVLESEGIFMDKNKSEAFNDLVEARFGVWSKSEESSYTGESNLKMIAKEVFKNAKIGGDTLVILRYIDNAVKVQVLDGSRICHPGNIAEIGDGNIVSNGIEMNAQGGHVAYWLRAKNGEPKRISAYSETGLRHAFLVKGAKWRSDYHRGLPVIAVVLESLGKLDRYKEAIIGNAEEIAKLVYQITHENFSDGANPFSDNAVLARFKGNDGKAELPVDEFDESLAKKVQATYGKNTVNLSKGSKIEPVQPTTAIRDFEPFYQTNAHIICAAVGIPPNVAFSLYTDSFSASRAATKDWDHTIDVERDDFTDQFYKYIYKYWFFSEVVNGKIPAVGYIEAYAKKNYMITESYTNMRFTGPHFPHIDPKKEVDAERAKLGDLGLNIPLTTVEQATEALGTGDSDSNMEQFADELETSKTLKLVPDVPIITTTNTDNKKGGQ